MDIEIQTELKPEYAQVRCRFAFRADAILQAFERAFEFAASNRRKAILFDMRDVTGEPFSTMERYAAGVDVAELQKRIGSDIAFAVVGSEPMINPQRFAETVGRNRGANARVFTDINEAVEWIKNVVTDAGAG